jgi:hypothetical protein
MRAFCRLSLWARWQYILDRISTVRESLSLEPPVQMALDEFIQRAQDHIENPRLIDSYADVHFMYRRRGSFGESVRAYCRLIDGSLFTSEIAVTFDHPDFIWIGNAGRLDDVTRDIQTHGKWVLKVPTVDAAIDVARALATEFNEGRLTWAKFLPYEIDAGGTYFILYSQDNNQGRRAKLATVADKLSLDSDAIFFVYDTDCHESEALCDAMDVFGYMLPADISTEYDLLPTLQKLVQEERFGETTIGLSDIQRQMVRTIVRPDVEHPLHHRSTFLVEACFQYSPDVLPILLSMLLDDRQKFVVGLMIAFSRAKWVQMGYARPALPSSP